MIDKDKGMREIDACMLADWIRNGEKGIVVDCRSFMEYNNCHVKSAVNAFYSKMIRRRLQKKGGCCDFIKKHLAQTIRFQANEKVDLVLYGSGSGDSARQEALSDGGFLHTLYEHLVNSKTDQQFSTVMVLKGGFVNFHLRFPELCDSSEKVGGANSPVVDPSGVQLTTPSMSAYLGDRSLPPNDGVTKILPNLYLGSQADALDQSLLKEHNITYVVNMSITCPRPEFLTNDEHFLRIPVHDSHAERLLPHFEAAFNFLEQVRERKEIALIHCLAGISRSPSMAIAYVMRHKRMTQDEAYRFVKEKRPSISPNFNFMGQLFEYEKMLQSAHILTPPPSASASPISNTDTSNNSSGSDSETNGAAKKVTRMPKSASVGHVPISAPAIRLQRPTRIDVPTSPGINEFGKRASDTPYPVHERPKQLSFPSLPPVPQTPTQEQPKLQRPTRFNPCCRQRRGIHLALDARKELPSPSTEMERLTFANSNELSVSNPIFPQQQPGVPLHSTQPSGSQTQSNVARASSSFSNFPTISENSVMYATNPVFQSVASRTPCSEDKPQVATLTLLRTPLEPGRVLLQKPTSLSSSSHSSPAFTSPHCSTESPESGFVEGQTSGFESASASAPVLHETSMETATPKPELPQNAADWELLASSGDAAPTFTS